MTTTEIIAWLKAMPEHTVLTGTQRYVIYVAAGQAAQRNAQFWDGLPDATLEQRSGASPQRWAQMVEEETTREVTQRLLGVETRSSTPIVQA